MNDYASIAIGLSWLIIALYYRDYPPANAFSITPDPNRFRPPPREPFFTQCGPLMPH